MPKALLICATLVIALGMLLSPLMTGNVIVDVTVYTSDSEEHIISHDLIVRHNSTSSEDGLTICQIWDGDTDDCSKYSDLANLAPGEDSLNSDPHWVDTDGFYLGEEQTALVTGCSYPPIPVFAEGFHKLRACLFNGNLRQVTLITL